MITMRILLATKKDSAILRKLRQLNIGVSYTTNDIFGSKWTIGSHEPTIDWIQKIRNEVETIDENAKRFGWISWLDRPITLQLDWTRHFGDCPTGPMI